ncbi:hypothetical protein GUJ93_ZPchr0004g38974 [Zizania palustris]|uniref:Uncharacterized protein n=1 Tax=Zizania palustris TaxID=103762 RepID=A0A8J5SXK6_ZIZPA|nr:hypothetical protein GUJ93_ZPchr0004g38974 [Zizania palustris]
MAAAAAAARKAVSRNRARRRRRTSMANRALLQEIFPMDCKCCMSSPLAELTHKQNAQRNRIPVNSEFQGQVPQWTVNLARAPWPDWCSKPQDFGSRWLEHVGSHPVFSSLHSLGKVYEKDHILIMCMHARSSNECWNAGQVIANLAYREKPVVS